MKIGIIIYSKTGNTRSVAQSLLETLINQGHDASLLEIKAASDDPEQVKVDLIERPNTSDFDRLIFASPVHGFMPSQVMKTYLLELDDLMQKKVTLFVTHQFPYAWMGGSGTLNQMKKYVVKKNGNVQKMFSINWSSKKRAQNIQDLLDQALL